jgi:hypothetical protein
LAEALRSVLAQTFHDLEVLIIDDGSVDGTCNDFSDPPPNVHYRFQTNQGESCARNNGMRSARGDLIAFLDSDDFWLPTKLERQVASLDDLGPEFGFIACDVYDVDTNGDRFRPTSRYGLIPSGDIDLETLLLRPPTAASSVIVRKTVLDEVGGFDEGLHYGEDADLWLRIAKKYRLAFLAEPLVCMRSHSNQQTSYLLPLDKLERRIADRSTIIERTFAGLAGDPDRLAALKDEAIAQDTAWASVSYFWNRCLPDGQRLMCQTIKLMPETYGDGRSLAELVVRCAESIITATGPNDAMAFLNYLFKHLPPEADGLAANRRRVFSHVHIASAFMYRSQRQKHRAMGHLVRGVALNPRWLRNRGVLSTLFKAACPSRAATHRNTCWLM